MYCNTLIGRTDNLTAIGEFLDPMCAPAYDAGDSKDRREQFRGKIQHAVDKAAVEVYIGAYALIDFALFGNDLRRQAFYQ